MSSTDHDSPPQVLSRSGDVSLGMNSSNSLPPGLPPDELPLTGHTFQPRTTNSSISRNCRGEKSATFCELRKAGSNRPAAHGRTIMTITSRGRTRTTGGAGRSAFPAASDHGRAGRRLRRMSDNGGAAVQTPRSRYGRCSRSIRLHNCSVERTSPTTVESWNSSLGTAPAPAR